MDSDYKVLVESPYFGQEHSLLVKVQFGGEYSANTKTNSIVVSENSPHVRDDVNVVGVFVPTPRVLIILEVADDVEH